VGDQDDTPIEVPIKLEPAPSSNGRRKTIAKTAAGVAVALVAAYGAVRPEETARKAIAQVQTSHAELRQKVVDLQKWARFLRVRAEKAEARAVAAGVACQAKVDGLRQLVTGVLWGESRASARRRAPRSRGAATAAPPEVKALVKALGSRKPAQRAIRGDMAELPHLKAPRQLKK
jgi:hypothetical protein